MMLQGDLDNRVIQYPGQSETVTIWIPYTRNLDSSSICWTLVWYSNVETIWIPDTGSSLLVYFWSGFWVTSQNLDHGVLYLNGKKDSNFFLSIGIPEHLQTNLKSHIWMVALVHYSEKSGNIAMTGITDK